MKRPVFFLALAILAGAVVGRVVLLRAMMTGVVAAGLIATAVWLGWKGKHPDTIRLHDAARTLLIAAVFCLGFFQQNEIVWNERKSELAMARLEKEGVLTLRATVGDEPTIRERRVSIVLRDAEIIAHSSGDAKLGGPVSPSIGQQPSLGGVTPPRLLPCRLSLSLLNPAAEAWRKMLPVRGQRLELRGVVKPLEPARSLELFDYGDYLHKQEIFGQIVVRGTEDIRRMPAQDLRLKAGIFSFLMQWRRSTIRLIDEILSPIDAGVMRAMLMGDTSALDRKTSDIFARVGANHIFSVSGLHTAFLALAIFCFSRLLQFSPRPAAWITLVLLCVYCAIVGFLSPVVRSAVMTGCLMIPYIARRAVDSLNALSVAAFLTMVFNPLAPFQTDFQFSYLCVFGLITLTPTLNELLCISTAGRSYRMQRLIAFYNYSFAQGLSVVIAAQLAVLPLLTIYYHQISIVALVANLVLVPVSSFLLAAGWLFSLLGPLSGAIAAGLGLMTSVLCDVFLAIGGFFASPWWASILTPSFPWYLIGFYYFLIFGGPHLAMRRAPGQLEIRRARMILRLIGVVTLIIWWNVAWPLTAAASEPVGDLQVTMLDVGQGDCFFVESADGNTILIDAGPRSAARRVREYLSVRGIDKISALLLTHSDSDHAGGAVDLIENITVERVVWGPPLLEKSPLREELQRVAAQRMVPTIVASQGDKIQGLAGTNVEVINPPRGEKKWGTNENSIVLRVDHGEMRFLFTGDAGASTEREMIQDVGNKGLEADVLKIGHHGSAEATSSDFLGVVRPRVALLSVGAHNPYHHPSPAVVTRLEQGGCEIFDTAVDGMVEMRTDGRELWTKSSRPKAP